MELTREPPLTPVEPSAPDAAPVAEGTTASPRWLLLVIAVLGVAATSMAVVAGGLHGAPAAGMSETFSVLVLLVLAAFLGLEFRAKGEGDRLDLFDAALATALVSLPGPTMLVMVVLAKAVTLTVQRVPTVKTWFNVAQWACAAAAGSLVFAALHGSGSGEGSAGGTGRAPGTEAQLFEFVVALVVALLVVIAVNAASVLLVLVLVGGLSVLENTARSLVRGTLVSAPANLALGLLFGVAWTYAPASRLVIPIAMVAVHLATRGWAQRQAGTSRLMGLQRASAVLAGPEDLAAATPRFLDELQQAFGCAGVELRLRVGDSQLPTRAACGYDTGEHRSTPLVTELWRQGRAARVSAPAHGGPKLLALMATAGWRDCLAVPVRCDGQVVGLLCTHDREGWEGFESAELGVLEAAAGVLGEAVRRGELAAVLSAERAALSASEVRWRVLARVLELVARGTPLPATLNVLASTLEEQSGGARCAVLVRAAGHSLTLAAPSVPASAVPALQILLLQAMEACTAPGRVWMHDLTAEPDGSQGSDACRDTLLHSEIRMLRAWALPCSHDGGGAGVLALCYPDDPGTNDHGQLTADAARVGALAVDHVLVQRRLAHQAAHDALTDLPNRAVFLAQLRRSLMTTERAISPSFVLVLFLDIDRFKVVNDSLGHGAGDALLCAIAERLRAAVRPGDMVARFGGDEFTMLCEGIQDEEHALQIVQRVQDVLAPPFPVEDSELYVTSSIGIALGSGLSQAPETLVENADAAMYRAKDNGGNCFELFDGAMRDRAVRRLATQSALHRALEREEFRVVYQPMVRLATGAIQGFEALLRWDRPQYGVVLPNAFVPLAEETGLIIPIGAYVLQEACRQAARWRDAGSGAPPSVSVNLSARQLMDPGLLPTVRTALQRNTLDPATICLEITESVLMSDVSASGQILSQLKALGVQLFVDDFGTGYSSLTYLQRFPMDGLKVDRSFVADLGSQANLAIVGAVVSLAHGLGLIAVAEGVETKDQLDRLVGLGCDVAQGYHFGRPAPPDDLPLGHVR